MSEMSKKKLSYSDYLFDKSGELNTKFSQVSGEILRLQNIILSKQKSFERFHKMNKNIKVKNPRKQGESLEPFFVQLFSYHNQNLTDTNEHIKNLTQRVETLEHLKKYVDNNRKFLNRRAMNNEKQYMKNKKMLDCMKRKQNKIAKEAHEWYIKHHRMREDPYVGGNQLQSCEMKLIHSVNEEKRFSKQYENVVKQTKDYQKKFVEENKEILQRYQEFDTLILSSVKSHLKKYIENQEEHIRKLKNVFDGLKNSINKINVEDHIQKFIVTNHNPYFKLEGKHKFEPFLPIYLKKSEDQVQILERSKNVELSIDKTSVIGSFLDVFKKKNQPKRVRKHVRSPTLSVIQSVAKIEPKAKVKEPEKSSECIYFEKFLKGLLETGKRSEEQLKEAVAKLGNPAGRLGFAFALNHNRSEPYIVEKKVFSIITDLMRKCLLASYQKQDPGVGKILLNMSHTFYTQGEGEEQVYLITVLKDLKLWKEIRFWQCVFYDSMSDMRTRSVYYLNDQKWKDLDKQERDNVAKEHANMTFGVLTSIVFSMMEAKVETEKVKKFIEKMCTLNSLSQEQIKIIKGSFEDMIKKMK